MTELQSHSADRSVSAEALAILLATLVAPVAAFLVNLSARLAFGESIAALEQKVAHPALGHVMSFISGVWLDPRWLALHSCFVAWLGVVPALMLLRAFGRLRLWTTLPAGAVLPLSTVSTITLLMWQSTSAMTSEKFVVYGLLVAMTVPAALAAATAFRGVYVRVNRHEERVLPEYAEARST